jgi:hypothetical protein
MNLHAKSQLLERFSVAPHAEVLKSTIETIFGLGMMVDSAKKRAGADPHLSETGRAAHVAKIAIDTLRPLIESTAGARKAARFNADRKASLKPPTPSRDDQVGEMRRQELRTFVRGLPMAERLPFALEHPEAILDAPAALSSLPEEQFEIVLQTYIAATFSSEIAEIETLSDDLATVRAAHDLALAELRNNSGLSDAAFSKILAEVVFEVDGI